MYTKNPVGIAMPTGFFLLMIFFVLVSHFACIVRLYGKNSYKL